MTTSPPKGAHAERFSQRCSGPAASHQIYPQPDPGKAAPSISHSIFPSSPGWAKLDTNRNLMAGHSLRSLSQHWCLLAPPQAHFVASHCQAGEHWQRDHNRYFGKCVVPGTRLGLHRGFPTKINCLVSCARMWKQCWVQTGLHQRAAQ